MVLGNPLRSLQGLSVIQRLQYGYANARVKGMRAHLMSQGQMEEMIGSRSVAELIGMLNNMGYKEDFVKPAVQYGGADLVELALGRNLARTFSKVLGFTPKAGRETISALIDRWDVHNISIILLAKSLGEPNEKIGPLLVNAGSLTDDEVKDLAGCGSVKEVVEELRGTRYYAPLNDSYAKYEQSKEISVLLSAVHAEYYSSLPSRIRASHRDEHVILGLVKSKVDTRNIMDLLRAKKAGMGKEETRALLFGGGNLSHAALDRLAEAERVEDVVGELKGRYELGEAFERFKKDGSLIHFEVALERRVVERGLRALRTSILSVGAIASFIFLKEEEINNIRKIVRGIEFEIPREEIKGMVVPIGG